jgi:hypothetical protein
MVSHSKEHLKAWWRPILEMPLDDPQQEPPFWVGTNNAVLSTPFPAIQIKALATVGTSEAGVFLSGTRRANLFAIQKDLKRDRLSVEGATAGHRDQDRSSLAHYALSKRLPLGSTEATAV